MCVRRTWVYRAGTLLTLLSVPLAGCAPPSMPPSAPNSSAGDTPRNASAPAEAPAPGVQDVSFPSPGGAPGAPVPGVPSVAGGATPSPTGASGDKSAAQPNDPDAFVVYVGDLGMTADANVIPSTLDDVVDIAESLGGHLAGRSDSTVKVKIPSRHFREGMTKIEKLADVTKRSVTADDVTAEFKDLEVRLENLRATRKRLEDFLGKAANITDTLTVERELERVALEIDTIQGRLRVLSDSTAFSVLTVSIAPKPKPVEIVVKETAPQKPRAIDLPVDWLSDIGVGSLLDLRRGS
jgi:hypothetical protein